MRVKPAATRAQASQREGRRRLRKSAECQAGEDPREGSEILLESARTTLDYLDHPHRTGGWSPLGTILLGPWLGELYFELFCAVKKKSILCDNTYL